ncbi:unnamed protein product [Orchesella dallaii]|uniref:Uncharacterized protein n=1 Tax=Orchesella dallaii TaxID=48710 RepID=A0ABP1RRV2_9HEXA
MALPVNNLQLCNQFLQCELCTSKAWCYFVQFDNGINVCTETPTGKVVKFINFGGQNLCSHFFHTTTTTSSPLLPNPGELGAVTTLQIANIFAISLVFLFLLAIVGYGAFQWWQENDGGEILGRLWANRPPTPPQLHPNADIGIDDLLGIEVERPNLPEPGHQQPRYPARRRLKPDWFVPG